MKKLHIDEIYSLSQSTVFLDICEVYNRDSHTCCNDEELVFKVHKKLYVIIKLRQYLTFCPHLS